MLCAQALGSSQVADPGRVALCTRPHAQQSFCLSTWALLLSPFLAGAGGHRALPGVAPLERGGGGAALQAWGSPGLHAFIAQGPSSALGQRTKVPQLHSAAKRNKELQSRGAFFKVPLLKYS